MRIILFPILFLVFCFPSREFYAQCSPPTYFGIMIHLEDNWTDANDSLSFADHAFRLRKAVGFVKPYGAKFTAECAIPFAEGCNNWNDNVLQSLIDSSMGVGSHSNSSADYAYTQLLVDGLVGQAQNRGVSGGWGPMDSLISNDWVDSASTLGFKYIDAPVYYAYLGVPQNLRPDSVSNAIIASGLYHDPAPPDLSERVHPHRVNSAFTWPVDTTGPVVLLTGSIGEISSIAEGRDSCGSSCVLDSADVDTIISRVNQAIAFGQASGKLTVIYMHTPLDTYTPLTRPVYDYLFQSLDPFINNGSMEYKTMAEIYDAFIQCETLTGLDGEATISDEIQIYPNPGTGKYTLDVADPAISIRHAEVFDLSGKSVSQITFSGADDCEKYLMDIGHLKSGMYFVRILTSEGWHSLKIVKQ